MKTKRFLSILLSLVLVLGMLPGMSLTASAADTTTTITSPATTGTMTITLTIAAASVKTAPEANTLTYSGSAQTLTTTGEAGVGTLQYQLGESATTEPTGTWITTVPQGTEAKDYYVWYRSRVNDTNISAAGCKTVTIAKASITNATVTLSDTSLVYTGSEQSVTVSSVKLGDTTLTADTDYEVTSGTTGTAKNTYTVTITGKGNYKDTATAQWSIGLATPTIDTIPTASAITYGQKLADSTLTGGVAKLGDTTVAGMFAWKNTESKPAVSDSDATEYDVVFTPTDADNYAAVECKVKLTVNKAAATVTAPTPKTLTYTGSPQELVNAGSTNDGTLYYAVTTENKAPTDESLYTTSIPTATDAGTYYVWYKVEGDANHENSAPACVTASISEADKEALTAAISEATEYYNTIKDNEAYSEIATALNAAIEAAQKVADNQNVTETEIGAAIKEITDAKAKAEADKQAADDAAAAQAVTEKINALPAADAVVVADREAIEAARAAYDALTDSQKAKVSAETLKKLTDAEAALAEVTGNSDTLLATLLPGGEETLNLSWTTQPDVRSYDVYFGKSRPKFVATVTGDSYTFTELKKGTAYKAYVKADGQTSPTVQCYTDKGSKPGANPGTVHLAQDEMTVTITKSAKIASRIVRPKGSKGRYSAKQLYVSSDPSVATVSRSGRVKGVGKGTCTVYVLNNNGVWISLKVTVDAQPTRVSFSGAKKQLKVGESVAIKARLTPEWAETVLTWSTSDPAVATVDESGTVTAVGAGRAVVTATAENGKSAHVTIRVKGDKASQKDTPEESDAPLNEGEQAAFELTGPEA